MKHLTLLGVSLLLTASSLAALARGGDVVFEAMKDEMDRGLARLQMEKLDHPYFIGLTVRDVESASTYSQFGAVVATSSDTSRFAMSDLRVGDYQFDNTNFLGGGFGGSRSGRVSLSLDDDYDVLRHSLWLFLDRTYKNALERISVKRAIAKTKTQLKRPPDFTRAEPVESVGTPVHLDLDLGAWAERVRKLSAIFREFPLIQQSGVELSAIALNQRYLSTEGAKVLRGSAYYELKAWVYTQAPDGMHLSDSTSFLVRAKDELPSQADAEKALRALGEKLTKLAQSPAMDDYTGPVLLTKAAAAQFFKILLADNLSDPVLPLLENDGMADRIRGQKLVTKLTRRVLPPFFEATDDPTRTAFKDKPLFGAYQVDDEGVAPRAVPIVEKGRLAGYYMSRTPTEKVAQSNGHGRWTGFGSKVAGVVGNLSVQSATPESFDELKGELIDACKDDDLEYGVIIDDLGDAGRPRDVRGDPALPDPVVIRRVSVKDGHEEWARGGSFGKITPKILKDIMAAADDAHVMNALDGGVSPFATPYSIVAPSILVKELDLKKSEGEKDKPPLIPHPYFAQAR
ncbi:MAG: metallopeptidase TldD-related protein [Candidatus Eisenbacteria bacterium]